MRGAAIEGVTGKGAGITKTVQYAGLLCIATGRQPVFALVEIKAGFMTGMRVNQDFYAVFNDFDFFRDVAMQGLDKRLQTFLTSYIHIAAFKDCHFRQQFL